MRQHMKSLQHAFYTHLGKQEPWDKEKNLLDNAIRESETYKNLKRQGLSEKAILVSHERKKAHDYLQCIPGRSRNANVLY